MHRVWTLLIKGDDRVYAGNEGYDDVVGSHYDYDSNVQNSKQVGEGDVVLLRDSSVILGVASVDRIEISPDEMKTLLRCASCKRTQIALRRTRVPMYRCQKCFAEFDVPIEDTVTVTTYRAHLTSWQPLRGLSVETLEQNGCFTARSKLNAIREVSPGRLRPLLKAAGAYLP